VVCSSFSGDGQQWRRVQPRNPTNVFTPPSHRLLRNRLPETTFS
jgi:hypothetical protein